MVEATEVVEKESGLTTTNKYLADLLPALQRLDRLLEQAIAAAKTAYGPAAGTDPYRGLYISQEEVNRLLAREPGQPALREDGASPQEESPRPDVEGSELAWLRDFYGLSAFDLDIILIVLAPELDLRYERLYAYLQDDVTRKRPSVDLVLNLLCATAAEKLERRTHFATDSPLIRNGVVHLIADPHHLQPPLLAHAMKLDDQIVRLLLGHRDLDSRLLGFCERGLPYASIDDLTLSPESKCALREMTSEAWENRRPLHLYFQGLAGVGKRAAAHAVANQLGKSLLVVDLARLLASTPEIGYALGLVLRECRFQDDILYIEGMDELRNESRRLAHEALLDAVARNEGITILAGTQPWIPGGRVSLGVLTVSFSMPDYNHRLHSWQKNLAAIGTVINDADVEALAGRFGLTAKQIEEAVTSAYTQARWTASSEATDSIASTRIAPTREDLFAAARAQSCRDLDTLARRVTPIYKWEDIVLPDDTMAQLRELCQRVTLRHRVFGEWGFGRTLSLGKGVTALFAGPSGTGKTMAAEIIASELGIDLYKINLATVVSKYIGETEKNLERIFRTAENSNACLFFDEADALFGKRSEVRDSHDRYANLEIAYLLQRMEEYDGIAILATNLRQNLDESFTRRLSLTVHFPFPDEASRRRIWSTAWPTQTPLAQDVAVEFSVGLKLSGGSIKNVVTGAAFLAAESGGPVTAAHISHAARREYQKMGFDAFRNRTAREPLG